MNANIIVAGARWIWTRLIRCSKSLIYIAHYAERLVSDSVATQILVYIQTYTYTHLGNRLGVSSNNSKVPVLSCPVECALLMGLSRRKVIKSVRERDRYLTSSLLVIIALPRITSCIELLRHKRTVTIKRSKTFAKFYRRFVL